MRQIKVIKKENIITYAILLLGVVARMVACVLASPTINQHDVLKRFGHYDYAVYIFNYWKLPMANTYEFAQPPINAIMQAIVMKIFDPFVGHTSNNYIDLYATTKILSLVYSSITLIIIYKILKEFDLKSIIKNLILAVMSFYPGILFMSTQYSNDNISYMFFYLTILLAIRWAKCKKMSMIILLALSIGIGMLTKISVGLVAFIIGPMMLAVLITTVRYTGNGLKKDAVARITTKELLIQLIIFAIIVFPIGLSYSLRNLLLFDQPMGAISEIAVDSILDMKKYNWTFIDRFLSIPIDRFLDNETGIYHSFIEYNAWIDLIKTAGYDEFNFSKAFANGMFIVIYVLNILFFFTSFIAFIITTIKVIKEILKKNINVYSSIFNFKMLCIMLYILALIAYIGFNVKYAYSCNTNYRYIAYITFAMIGLLVPIKEGN